MTNVIDIEKFIKEIKPKFKNYGDGISQITYQELCKKYNKNLINFLFPSYLPQENIQLFYCKETKSLEKMENDWVKIKAYLDEIMSDIAFMNISLDDYYNHIKMEFFEYKHFSKNDIIYTYNNN